MNCAIAIMGPTAVGKSWLSLELARRLSGEIVSADALQAYRGFDRGTAKPSMAERREVPHHLIDILEPHEIYSAGDFARRARAVIEAIEERGRQVLIVGGSGFYLSALLDGLSPIPPVERQVTEALRRELELEGAERLWRRLQSLDPETAARLEQGDSQRIVRALAVLHSSGRPLSDWITEEPAGDGGVEAIRIGLTLPRTLLYDQISERIRIMIQTGWVEEVEDLLNRGLSPHLPAFQAIGYREVAAYIRNETTLEEAVATTVRATCRYAKRQLTWFRRDEHISWYSIENRERCLQEVTRRLAMG